MRVRPRRSAAPYLNAADQRRMLGMVGALGLVLFAASWAADPTNWYWIAPPAAVPAAAPLAGDERPDFTVRDAAAFAPPPGAILVTPAAPDAGAADEPDGRLPAGLTQSARDRTLGLNRAEREAVAAILARLAEDPPAGDAAAGSFPALMRDPDFYRGKPVRLGGGAKGVRDLPPSATYPGGAVEVWFYPPDAGENPVRVLANRADGLPRAALLDETVPVTVTGALFKLQGYAARGPGGEERTHVAPLLLADAVAPATIVAAVPQTPAALPWVVLGVIAAALLAGGLLVWRWRAGDRAYERRTLDRLSAASGAGGEPLNLPAADDADPGAFLAGLGADTDVRNPGAGEPGAQAPAVGAAGRYESGSRSERDARPELAPRAHADLGGDRRDGFETASTPDATPDGTAEPR